MVSTLDLLYTIVGVPSNDLESAALFIFACLLSMLVIMGTIELMYRIAGIFR